MKKHSKTGVESRFQGTVLGVPAEPRTVKIEGAGADLPDSIEEWCRRTREKAAKAAESNRESREPTNHVETIDTSIDVAMETE
jgi:transcription initiation factor TFIID subunit 3